MKCRLPMQCAHELFLCIGFSFYGCYSSQQLSQNHILLTTIKFKTFQDYFVKFKDFKALNLNLLKGVQSEVQRDSEDSWEVFDEFQGVQLKGQVSL